MKLPPIPPQERPWLAFRRISPAPRSPGHPQRRLGSPIWGLLALTLLTVPSLLWPTPAPATGPHQAPPPARASGPAPSRDITQADIPSQSPAEVAVAAVTERSPRPLAADPAAQPLATGPVVEASTAVRPTVAGALVQSIDLGPAPVVAAPTARVAMQPATVPPPSPTLAQTAPPPPPATTDLSGQVKEPASTPRLTCKPSVASGPRLGKCR